MKPLRIYNRNQGLYVTTHDVAPLIELPHDELVSGINRIVDILQGEGEDVSEKFIPRKKGKKIEYYLLSRSGCDMVAIELTPDEKKRLRFEHQYTNSFREKEEIILLHSEEWLKKRRLNTAITLNFQDKLKEFVEYAKQNGSNHASMYYTNCNKLIDKAVGLKPGDRDMATAEILDVINKANTMAIKIIDNGIAGNVSYKDIYQSLKSNMDIFKEIRELTASMLPMGVEE